MAEARQSLEMLASVVRAVNLGVVVLDQHRRVVLWNRWMIEHASLDADAVLGRALLDVFPELRNKRVEGAIGQALQDNFPSVLSQTLHKSPFPLYTDASSAAQGERMQQAVAITPIEVAGAARHCLIQISDVSVAVARDRLLREQALELRSQSYSDGLTGIANRRHFDVALEKEVRRAKRTGADIALLMIDIDYFKAYNDYYGHQQGDDCLIQVAGALAAMLQRPTDLIARYGGEEFAVILPDVGHEQSLLLAESMRRRIEEVNIAHARAGATPHVTISIGVATQCTAAPLEAAGLLGAADRALYAAKRLGRNRVVPHDQA